MQDDPIQNLDAVDVLGKRKDGGLDLVIVVSAPLEDSERHRELVAEKINTYLAALQEDDFRAEFPDPAFVRIVLSLQAPASLAVTAWVHSLAPAVREYGAELVVEART